MTGTVLRVVDGKAVAGGMSHAAHGTRCPTASSTARAGQCTKGYYRTTAANTLPSESCIACPLGSYKNSSGDAGCTSCSNNLTTLAPGAADSSACVEPLECGANSYLGVDGGGGVRCEACGAGEISAAGSVGKGACVCLSCLISLRPATPPDAPRRFFTAVLDLTIALADGGAGEGVWRCVFGCVCGCGCVEVCVCVCVCLGAMHGDVTCHAAGAASNTPHSPLAHPPAWPRSRACTSAPNKGADHEIVIQGRRSTSGLACAVAEVCVEVGVWGSWQEG